MNKPFAWLTALGLGAVGAHFLGFDFHLFDWINSFGDTAGRAIRAALAAGGVVVFMLAVGRPESKRGSARGAGGDSATSGHPQSAGIHRRWPKLARRSAYLRNPPEPTAPVKRSRVA